MTRSKSNGLTKEALSQLSLECGTLQAKAMKGANLLALLGSKYDLSPEALAELGVVVSEKNLLQSPMFLKWRNGARQLR